MTALPPYEILVYEDGGTLPAEAKELFAPQLAHSRKIMRSDAPDRAAWRYVLVAAVAAGDHVLGGVHLNLGPIGGAGPLAGEKLAYVERTLVRPEYRRCGVATRLMQRAVEFATATGCLLMRLSNNWDNEAERRLLLNCGFALVDLDGEHDPEPCYLAVRPLPRGTGAAGGQVGVT